MEHLGTKSLETQRLVLRPFVLEDAQDMYNNWASDPEVTRFLTWQPHEDVEMTESMLMEWISQYGKTDFYFWAITQKGSGQPIGSISVVGKDDSVAMVEMGYCIGRQWWGQGIVAEALGRVIDYLFQEVEINRIVCKHDTNNPASGKVMQKCGLRHEGTMRQASRNNQGVCDSAVYAILRQDYIG